MACYDQLISFHIVEKINNNNMVTWSFPTISLEHTSLLEGKCFAFKQDNLFIYLRCNGWLYIQHNDCTSKPFAIVLIAKDLQPEKYRALCSILCKTFQKSADRVELVKQYLNVFIKGNCNVQDNGAHVIQDFTNFKSPLNIKEIIKEFGLEIIIIYIAILLKKRILVYHNSLVQLQKDLVALSSFVSHRNPNTYLLPYVENVAEELRGRSFFMAGATSNKWCSNSELYDIYIDLVNKEIRISPHATDNLTVPKIFKEVATTVVQLSEKDAPEEQIISELSKKTSELLNLLNKLATVDAPNGKMITIEVLKAGNFSPAVENFLFNFAIAENMMML